MSEPTGSDTSTKQGHPHRHAESKTPIKNTSQQNSPRMVLTMSTTGYARVSTDDQDLTSQIDALRAAGCDPIYTEHASGATMERPQWIECSRGLGKGDTLVVVRIDRLGRSLPDLVNLLDNLGQRGIRLQSLNEGIDTTTTMGKLFFQLCATFAEYERNLIRERTRAGLDAARAAGRRIGRPPALTPEQRSHVQRLREQGEGVATIARILEVSPSTIRRAIQR